VAKGNRSGNSQEGGKVGRGRAAVSVRSGVAAAVRGNRQDTGGARVMRKKGDRQEAKSAKT
jgi:hypothetical protein